MYVRTLHIRNFRNYTELDLSFTPGPTVFIGENAAGKSNLLETIYYLHSGKSLRAVSENEVIQWEAIQAHITSEIVDSGTTNRIGIALSREQEKIVHLNRKPLAELGRLRRIVPVLYLSNRDGELLSGEPFFRRRFLNQVLLMSDGEYGYYLQKLKRILLSRNELLRQIRDEDKKTDVLSVWNESLAEVSRSLTAKRRAFILNLQPILQTLSSSIAAHQEIELLLEYRTNCPEDHLWEEAFRSLQEEEIRQGKTLIGPQRDEVDVFFLKQQQKKLVRIYGSQGQLTLIAYLLKLSQAEFIRSTREQWPIVEGDDIFSEIDLVTQKKLVSHLQRFEQVFIATTDSQVREVMPTAAIYRVKDNTCVIDQ